MAKKKAKKKTVKSKAENSLEDTKLSLTSMNVIDERIEQLKTIFPEVYAEDGIDFTKLKASLGESIADGPERYGLNWAGKREAFHNVQTLSTGTLRPVPEESVNFKNTENLIIEGDNLEVLKLLQKSYYGKIKMIYIDPPYNTGNEFIYPDDYREGLQTYLRYTKQVSDKGVAQTTNKETSGRFHSIWLNMMYPRLYLAKNLLKDNGVIFVSIDDNEVSNIRALLNEIFGEENFVGNMIWKNVTDNNPTNIATEHEYIVVYAKSKINLEPIWKSNLSDVKDVLINIGNELIGKYDDENVLQEKYSEWFRENKNQLWPLENYKFIDKNGVYSGERGVHNPGKEGYRYDIIHPETLKPCKEPLMGYRFPEETMNKMIDEGRIIFGKDEDKLVEIKVYAKDYMQKLSSVINLDGRAGANELRELFPETEKVFSNPKPIELLKELISFSSNEDDIILDFFAGSGTTAHSILSLNEEKNVDRKFILVQLPEHLDKKNENQKKAYEFCKKLNKPENLAELTKERVRRAICQISNEIETKKSTLDLYDKSNKKLDLGYKALKLDESNFSLWDGEKAIDPENLEKQLRLYAEHVKHDRSQFDILYEILLKTGFQLTVKIDEQKLGKLKIFNVDDGDLVVCLDDKLTEAGLRAVIKTNPRQVICLDSAFQHNDQLKTNTVLEMKSHDITFHTV